MIPRSRSALSRSTEPDYIAEAVGFDVSHEVFGGMTVLSLGTTRARDQVGKKGEVNFKDQASHWQYRAGVTQILTPRWLVSLNAEAVADSGYLGSPYRAARVFGAAVPERNPRTRSSRAFKLRSLYDTGQLVAGSSLRAEYRRYWDNWDIKASTTEFGWAQHVGPGLAAGRQPALLFTRQGAVLQRQRAGRDGVCLAQPPAQQLQEHRLGRACQLHLAGPAAGL